MERAPITKQGKERLEAEVRKIKAEDRPANIKAIEEARAHGDLSENAEYHAAKDQQGKLAARLSWLEDLLARSEVIEPGKEDPDRIIFGCLFSVTDIDSGEKKTYRIVGEYELDPQKGLLSVASPLARAFIGKTEGDEVVVNTPGGKKIFEVLDIKKN